MKVGGECFQRDCHRVSLERLRSAELSVAPFVWSVGTWKVAGVGKLWQAAKGLREDGNTSLASNIAFVRTVQCVLNPVALGIPAALA